jgi:integrase
MAKGQILPRARSRWLLRLYQGRDPVSQSRTYKNIPVSGTRESAESELARQLTLRPPRPTPASSFSDYIEYWLAAAIEPRLRAKTARDYRGHLARYALPSIGQLGLQDLASLDLQSVYSGLLARRLSPRTIRYTHAVVHAALEQAKIWNLIPANPANGLTLPRAERREFEVLTPEEARRFVAAASLDPDGLVLLVALVTGLRPSEYLALRHRDFDRDRNTFTVEHTIERVPGRRGEGSEPAPGRWKTEETKRPRSRRTVPIPSEVAARVAGLVDRQANLFDAKPVRGARIDRLIFRTPRGKPIHERNLVQRVFKPLLRRAGLPDFRLYDLRHSFATLALRAGTPARLVSEQLGHSSVAFTLETYGHVLEETRGEAAERLSDLILAGQLSAERAPIDAERKPVLGEAGERSQKLA